MCLSVCVWEGEGKTQCPKYFLVSMHLMARRFFLVSKRSAISPTNWKMILYFQAFSVELSKLHSQQPQFAGSLSQIVAVVKRLLYIPSL